MYNFCTLAGISVVFDTCFKYINQRFAFMWRRCLTENLIRKWKKKRLNIEGSAQRIQEDCLKFTRIVESLYVGILKAVSNLVVFTPALWSLSNLVFPNVPGLLWFLALFYSIGGIIFSWWMGRRLPQLEFNNQVQEASFRTALEYKKGKYRTYIDNVQSNYYALYFEYFKFNLWGNSFFQASVIFPYAICGSALFAKLITLGTLVQISKAFDNIQGSLSYLIERWTDITELRSVTNRLNVFLTK
jgi:peptide/bleomycin uptake transporter